MIGLDNIKSKANEKGITILEALVSTAIIGIGFVAIFQMVDICNNRVSGKNCSYRNVDVPSAIYEELYIGKMEAKMNNGKKIKYLYFPIK